MGESAPRLLSRKKAAESIAATNNMMGLDWADAKILIGGSDDQTLPFIVMIREIKNKEKKV